MRVGKVTHYFTNIGVAVLKLEAPLAVGDKIRVKGETTDFERMNGLVEMRKKIESIQIFPFQLKTISAAISIIVISLIPKIIEIILKTLFQ